VKLFTIMGVVMGGLALAIAPAGPAVCTWQRDQGAVSIGFAGADGGNPAAEHDH
jgi:hypothetical protein